MTRIFVFMISQIFLCTVTVHIVLCLCFYVKPRLVRIEKKKWSHKLIDPFIFIIKARVSSSEKCIYLFYKLFTVYLRRAFMILSLFAVYIFYRTNEYIFCCCRFMRNGIEVYWWQGSAHRRARETLKSTSLYHFAQTNGFLCSIELFTFYLWSV